MIDANRWQYLIETSLPYLQIFIFNFLDHSRIDYDEQVIELQLFQTDFWTKQHQWYIDFETDGFSSLVYTIPYIFNQYKLSSTVDKYPNPLTNNSNKFDNVKELSLEINAINPESSDYFQNVQSLILIHKYKLSRKNFEYLDIIINLSNITKLTILNQRYITPLVFIELLTKLFNISSLSITTSILKSFFTDRLLCEYLNKMIKKLHIYYDENGRFIPENQINLFCKTFSNIEYLKCYLKTVNDLVFILNQCSKLSIIDLDIIHLELYSWIQRNASMLNVYLNFTMVTRQNEEWT